MLYCINNTMNHVFASRQRTEKPTSYFLSFFSPDRKERNKEKVTAAFHPFLDGIFYSS